MAQRTVSIVVEVTGAEDATRQVRQMRSALDDFTSGGKDGLTQILRQSREVNQAMKEMQQGFNLGPQQKGMLNDLDTFFRRILTGARTTGDVFKNIWKEVSDFLRRTLEQMTSSWTLNLGGVFSLVPGFGGGGGFLGGGLAGSGIGSALSGLGGTLGVLGAFGGPIGAVAGLGLGLLFGGGKKDQQNAAIANQGFGQIWQAVEDYKRFRRDYGSTIDTITRLWNEMAGAFTKDSWRSGQRQYYDMAIRDVQQTEDERNRRRQLRDLLPVPEFQTGGAVADNFARARGGGILSILHPGEFVMNRQAVERLGVSALEGLNKGEVRSQESGVRISLEPASAQTLSEMLKQNPQALEEGLLVVLRRGGPASRVLRG